jgi:hypothetical protein
MNANTGVINMPGLLWIAEKYLKPTSKNLTGWKQ